MGCGLPHARRCQLFIHCLSTGPIVRMASCPPGPSPSATGSTPVPACCARCPGFMGVTATASARLGQHGRQAACRCLLGLEDGALPPPYQLLSWLGPQPQQGHSEPPRHQLSDVPLHPSGQSCLPGRQSSRRCPPAQDPSHREPCHSLLLIFLRSSSSRKPRKHRDARVWCPAQSTVCLPVRAPTMLLGSALPIPSETGTLCLTQYQATQLMGS